MTIPAAAGKTNVDQGASDTPAAGRQDIEGLIDKFNVLRTHLLGSAITSTPATVGDGLEVASNALRVKADGSSIAVSSNGIKIAPGAARVFGEIIDYGGATAPAGWALCDGGELNRTTHADLFAVIGTTFGTGNGTDTFNVPDLCGRNRRRGRRFAESVDRPAGWRRWQRDRERRWCRISYANNLRNAIA